LLDAVNADQAPLPRAIMLSGRLLRGVALLALLASEARAEPSVKTPAGRATTPVRAEVARSSEMRRPPAAPTVELGVEPLWEGRFFRHKEFTTPNLRRYDANGYAAFGIAAELFPLATMGPGFWRGFGVTFRYARAFGFESDSARLGAPVRKSSLPVDTSFFRYAAGLRYRFAVNAEGRMPLDLAASASVCGWNFDFGPDLPRGPDLEAPTADYRMIRLAFDAAAALPPVTFFAALGYLHGFSIAAPSSREMGDLQYLHIPSAVGVGAEARAAIGVTLWRSFELRLSAEYAAFAFHLKPLPGRADEPARVVDSYVSVGLGPHARF
jgi:hypothetical protein